MIWIISSFDTAKSLEEPQKISMKEIWYAHSELLKICGMDGQSLGIRRRKIYPLIFCNIFLVIILCMLLWIYEKTNMHSHNMSFNYEICHWSHS